jgi:predicted HicB family RNase H-like nuclease
MLEYKGYAGIVELDSEAHMLHGRVIGLRDVVTFEGRSVDEVERAFRESVDDYLAFCAERGESPDKPFSGKFVLRVDSDTHRKMVVAAARESKSLNAWAVDVLAHAAG